jgi:hypothetical protein
MSLTILGKEFRCDKAWQLIEPRNEARQNLQEILETYFYRPLEDHTVGNTREFILEKEGDQHDYILYCSHFEHSTGTDMVSLGVLLNQLDYALCDEMGFAEIVLLDAYREKLIIRVSSIQLDPWIEPDPEGDYDDFVSVGNLLESPGFVEMAEDASL